MTESIIKKLSEIRRPEWIAYRWHEISAVGGEEPRYERGLLRNPNDALWSGENWDAFRRAYKAVEQLEKKSATV